MVGGGSAGYLRMRIGGDVVLFHEKPRVVLDLSFAFDAPSLKALLQSAPLRGIRRIPGCCRKEKRMFEYVAVAGGGIQDWWTGQALPFLDMIRASSYFWPGVAAATFLLILAMRQIVK